MKKIAFSFSEEEIAKIADLAKMSGVTKNQALRNAVKSEWLMAERVAAGGKIVVRMPDGSEVEVLRVF